MKGQEARPIDTREEIMGNRNRYRDLESVKKIIEGHIKPAYYYCAYGMFEDAYGMLSDARERIESFERDVPFLGKKDLGEVSLLKHRIKWAGHAIRSYQKRLTGAA